MNSAPATSPPAPLTRLAEHRRQRLDEVVAQLDVLPTSLAVPMRVLRLQRTQGAGMAELADAISADAGLTLKVMSLANSAAFSPVNKVTRLSQALAMIGLKNLMPLVFGLSLAGIFNRLALPGADRDALFRAALLKAIAAREVAAKLCPDQAEEAFLAALMQDVALPFMHAADRSAWPETLLVLDIQEPAARHEREVRMYGQDHAAIGRIIVQRLALPELFQVATGHHHAGVAALAPVGNPGLATALDLAAALPHSLGQSSGQAVRILANRLAPLTPAPRADAASQSDKSGSHPSGEWLKSLLKAYTTALATLGEADEKSTVFKEFLQDLCAQVAGCMEAAVEESASVIGNLRSRQGVLLAELDVMKRELARGEYDHLSDALTRHSFLTRAAELLDLARKHKSACVVGLADLDGFREVNHAHGHAAGDAALRLLGSRLVPLLRGRGLVGRLGADEFAFVLVSRENEKQPPVAAQLAEWFIRALSGLTLTLPAGQEIQLAASVGMIPAGVPADGETIESLLRRADEVLTTARQGGATGRCLVGTSLSNAA